MDAVVHCWMNAGPRSCCGFWRGQCFVGCSVQRYTESLHCANLIHSVHFLYLLSQVERAVRNQPKTHYEIVAKLLSQQPPPLLVDGLEDLQAAAAAATEWRVKYYNTIGLPVAAAAAAAGLSGAAVPAAAAAGSSAEGDTAAAAAAAAAAKAAAAVAAAVAAVAAAFPTAAEVLEGKQRSSSSSPQVAAATAAAAAAGSAAFVGKQFDVSVLEQLADEVSTALNNSNLKYVIASHILAIEGQI